MRALSLVVASGGHSSSRCADLSLLRPLLLRSTSSRRAGLVVVAHRPSCSAACGIFPDQGSNPCRLHWQADSQPLRHQGSPVVASLCCGARTLGTRASVVVARGLSSCGSWALERRLSSCGSQALELRLSSCGSWASLLCSMWDLPRPGLEPALPALAGRFLTTVPPGKSLYLISCNKL